MKKVLPYLLGVLILVGAFFGYKYLSSIEKPTPPPKAQVLPVAFTQLVKNSDIPIVISNSGQLMAKDRIEIFAEVTGVFQKSARDFKPGTQYSRGDLLLSIDASEHLANLRSQKSNFYNQVLTIMPDLKLDYPAAFAKWDTYVRQFDMEAAIPNLPEATSDKEKYFIAGRNLPTAYYNIKNLETRLGKYRVSAPFTGVLVDATVTPGSLVRTGQKLGEFIANGTFEMEMDINSKYNKWLKKGRKVELNSMEGGQSWTGTITRINGKIDQTTQSIKTYIEVKGTDLREGMYLNANLEASKSPNAFEISRKLLVDNSKIFMVKDSVLSLIEIDPVYFSESTAIIKGLADGTEILSQMLPGAYDGMVVNVSK